MNAGDKAVRRHTDPRWGFVIEVGRPHYVGGGYVVTGTELQAIVQTAYDQFGILAEPSIEREADRAPDVVGMIHDHVNAAHAQQAANGVQW